MGIAVICGSSRKNGNTETLVNRLIEMDLMRTRSVCATIMSKQWRIIGTVKALRFIPTMITETC